MTTYIVTCVDTIAPGTHAHHITRIGNCAEDWTMSVETVVEHIKNGDEFLVPEKNSKNQTNPVTVVEVELYEPTNKLYIKTKPNQSKTDNLLSLQRCNC